MMCYSIRMRCCHMSDRAINITSCAYTGAGVRFLHAPWPTLLETQYDTPQRQVIQTFGIVSGYVNARMCSYSILDKDVDEIEFLVNKCEGVKRRTLKVCTSYSCTCMQSMPYRITLIH